MVPGIQEGWVGIGMGDRTLVLRVGIHVGSLGSLGDGDKKSELVLRVGIHLGYLGNGDGR